MSLQIGIGFSDGRDAYAVGVNACLDALRKVKMDSPLFGLVFSSGSYDHKKVVTGIKSVLKDVPLIGASSAGEIVHGSIVNKNSVLVVLMGGDGIFFSTCSKGFSHSMAPDLIGKEAGERLMREMGARPDISFIFSDVLSEVEQHKVAEGLLKATGAPIFGGGSADNFEFKRTFQYFKDSVVIDSAVFASLKGDLKFGIGIDHGMLPVGMPRVVTESKGVNVNNIDGKPAISLYGEYFGYKDLQPFIAEPIGKLSLSYPLGYRWDIVDEDLIVRAPLLLKSDGSMVCTDNVPEGSYVQIMISDKDESLKSVDRAAKKAQSMLGEDEKASLALLVSGAGRRYSYGESLDDEVRKVEESLGYKVPIVGFYSYGSMCAIKGEADRSSYFQDSSIGICLLK